jgi:asparagine synthase (glutamine-hydrolysing)
MNLQWGTWNFDGRPSRPDYIEKSRVLLAPQAPEGIQEYSAPGIHILHFPLHSADEPRGEAQTVSPRGKVFTWDGRLDNSHELALELRIADASAVTDMSIAAAAYERWGTASLGKFLGDWALSVWDPSERNLLLAKDFLGTRHLYYSVDHAQVRWSTALDVLVLLSEKPFDLEQEYLAGWLSFYPAADLTPYAGVRSVPPSSLVAIAPGKVTVEKYWDFDPAKTIRYRTDREYEEHFRVVFSQSVRRRMRSDAPVLAELSGGIDSSSIVCTADDLFAKGVIDTPRLDTVSYYNDSEPHWNERPYFARVEEKRGRTGHHVPLDATEFLPTYTHRPFAPTPSSCGQFTVGARKLSAIIRSHGYRVLLSGIGGDETLGGVPTPVPELMDLLVRFRLIGLARQIVTWALVKRKPVVHLVADILRQFLPASIVGIESYRKPASWLDVRFVRRYRKALAGYPQRSTIFGPLPSFQENLHTLELLRRQLACAVPMEGLIEKRYPYLDRDLLEFVYAIPRDQLVQPHQRRSLMRRALSGIVPEAVLNRRRKAFVARGPLTAIATYSATLAVSETEMLSASLGVVNPTEFAKVLEAARFGLETPLVGVLRTLQLEGWLRHLCEWNLLKLCAPEPAVPTLSSPERDFDPKRFSSEELNV